MELVRVKISKVVGMGARIRSHVPRGVAKKIANEEKKARAGL